MTETIWRTALRQASATCRGSGQHWVADSLDELQAEIDLIEKRRDSVKVVRGMREENARMRSELIEMHMEVPEHLNLPNGKTVGRMKSKIEWEADDE
jgi:hypothetical protein